MCLKNMNHKKHKNAAKMYHQKVAKILSLDPSKQIHILY